MVTEYIRYKIQSEKIAQFIADYKKAAVPLASIPILQGL